MAQMMDKSGLFLSPDKSDFNIVIGDQTIPVHKWVLMSSSEYFNALFNSEMIETKTKEISLKETLIKPFIIVLKLSYEIVITEEEWNGFKIPEVFESIITANKYQFIECEKILSQKIIDIFSNTISVFGPEVFDSNHVTNSSSVTIWELLEMAKLHNLMFLIDLCLGFFDENISYAFMTFDKQFISADILLDVISRDTFGAQEIEIFKIVEKWIHKNRIRYNLKCIEETLLLESVRLNLINSCDLRQIVYNSDLYEPEFIDHIIKHELNEELAQNKRMCYESGKLFTTNTKNETHLRNDDKVSVCVTFHLQMSSKVNHILFSIKPVFYGELYMKFNCNYWIGIPDNNSENGFRKLIDYKQYSCIGEQELYFEKPFVTNTIRICFESNLDINETNETQTPGLIPDRNLFNISSLTFEYSKHPLKIVDNCIVPQISITHKSGADCFAPFLGFADFHQISSNYFNDVVLNKNENIYKYDIRPEFMPKSSKMKSKLKSTDVRLLVDQRIQTPIRHYDEQSPPYYLIRLPQPIFVDCLHFKLLMNKKTLSDDCLSAECKIEFCSEFVRDLTSLNWITISDESYLTESGYYNLEFELRKVLVIRITGFRFNSDRTIRYPLNIRNFSIPADRNSMSWSSGSKLVLDNNFKVNDSQVMQINRKDLKSHSYLPSIDFPTVISILNGLKFWRQ